MGLFDWLFSSNEDEEEHDYEHAVIVHCVYGNRKLSALFSLEKKLERAIAKARAGELDGNEVAADGSEATPYMYGTDADRLFEVVRPILDRAPFMAGATVTLRYGPPDDGVEEKEVVLGS